MRIMTFVLLMAMATEVAVAQSNSSPQTMTVCTETMKEQRVLGIPFRTKRTQCNTNTISGTVPVVGGGLGMAPVGVYAPRCPECVTSQTIAYIRDDQVRSADLAAARIAELQAELARERARTSRTVSGSTSSRTGSTAQTTTTPVVPAVPAKTPAQIAAEEAERRRRAAEILREEAGGAP